MIQDTTQKANLKVFLGASVTAEIYERLSEESDQTGNRSRIVEKALRQYFGLNNTPDNAWKKRAGTASRLKNQSQNNQKIAS